MLRQGKEGKDTADREKRYTQLRTVVSFLFFFLFFFPLFFFLLFPIVPTGLLSTMQIHPGVRTALPPRVT